MSSGFIGVLSRKVGLVLFICDLIDGEHYHRENIPSTRQSQAGRDGMQVATILADG
jgi:hypothetical protein